MRFCRSMLPILLATPFALVHGQTRPGATVAAGLAWGHQSDRTYSTTSWAGFHIAVTLPGTPRAGGAVALDLMRDVYWNGNGDDCSIRPPIPGCVPDPPSVSAFTIGWLQLLGRSPASVYVGAGPMSGRGDVAAGGVARGEVRLGRAFVGLQAFGQYTLVPSFHGRSYQVLIAGLNLILQ
jgi:hypothetical protein